MVSSNAVERRVPKLAFAASVIMAAIVFAASVASAGEVSKEFIINGPAYKKIIQLKDLVADILPPPAYIIESYLVAIQLNDAVEKGADKKTIDDLIEYGRKLKEGSSTKAGEFAGYFERMDVWIKDLPTSSDDEKQIKDWMVVKSLDAAKKFYEIRDTKFIPAIQAGDANTAKTVSRTELKPLYEQHRAAIDEVVKRCKALCKKLENEVVVCVSKGDLSRVVIGGEYYTRIVMLKDLIADVLPPPRYIIESHLVNLRLIDEVESGAGKDVLSKLIENGRQLKEGMSIKGELAGYVERQNFWTANLADKSESEIKIKSLMLKDTYEPAMKFYDIRDKQFFPLILKGDVAGAKKMSGETLEPLYNEHRKKIDDLVAISNSTYESFMKDVNEKLKK